MKIAVHVRVSTDDQNGQRQLYLYGEPTDERIEESINAADIEAESELAELRKRIETLEEERGSG